MKFTINGFIQADKAQSYHSRKEVYLGHIIRFRDYESEDGITIQPHALEFDLPDNWSPVPEQVVKLEEKLVQLDAAYVAGRTEIQRQIQTLLAISNCVEAA